MTRFTGKVKAEHAEKEAIHGVEHSETKTSHGVEHAEAVDDEPKVKKSIVPNKYAGKYKKPADELAVFIEVHCNNGDKFDSSKFFDLCRANGIDEAHIKPYEMAVNAKEHGAIGRARMTLRNRLASVVRKEKGLRVHTGDAIAHPVHLEPLPTRVKPVEADKAA